MKNERVRKLNGQWFFFPKSGIAGIGPFVSRDAGRAYAQAAEPTGIKTAAKPPAAPAPTTVPLLVPGSTGKTLIFGSLTAPTTVVPKPKLKTKVLFLLDSSGSMASIARPTVDAFNQVLKAIRDGAAATGQEATVSLYTFGETYQRVSQKYFNQDIAQIRPMSYGEFHPEDMTPMFDGIGQAINDALALKVDENTSFVLNVITDGVENASRRFSAGMIKDLFRQVQATDKWTVTFLVPPGSKSHLVNSYGTPEGNVQEWEATAAGARTASQQISTGYTNYFTSRSVGETFTKGFFTPDLSKVDANLVKSQLTNLAAKVEVLKVPKEMDIQAFVESEGRQYARGKGYYQLTKDEKVQAYKQILLKEKTSPNIYGGKEARDLLGLPDGANVKVRPGNHGNWDIFIQSTSNNRILVRGTTFLYER